MPLPAFLAFDTETATPAGEICSIAWVLFEDGVPTQSWQSLVNPQVYIWPRFTQVHGIAQAQVRSAPEFGQVWREIGERFARLPVVAHNLAFDHGVLAKNLAAYGLPMSAIDAHCTLAMARRLWPKPQLADHRLPTVAAHLGVALDHHDALSDARACGHVAVAALKKWGAFAS